MDNYYKTDVCDGNGGCKLYNPLLTQGQCKYLNEWYEQKEKIKMLEKALELAVKQLYPEPYYKFDISCCEKFIELARKELENVS